KSYDESAPGAGAGGAASMMPANFKSYDDPAPQAPVNMPYCQPRGACVAPMPAYLGNGQIARPMGPYQLLSNPGLPTSAPMMMPVNYAGGMPVDPNFQPTMPV